MLTTNRLQHRLFTPLDLDRLTQIRATPNVAKYIGGAKATTGIWIKSRLEHYLHCYQTLGFGVQTILLKETEELIGWSGLQPIEGSTEIQLTYGLAAPYWRQGFGYETAAAWLQFGFATLELNLIVALTLPENKGSWKLMEKLGMRSDGTPYSHGTICKRYAISRAAFETASRGR